MLSASAYICRIINRRRKDESISVNGEPVAVYRLALSLSKRNREWLAGKLLEDSHGVLEEPQEEYISKEEVLEKIDSGLKDVKAGRTKTYEEFMRDWDDEV